MPTVSSRESPCIPGTHWRRTLLWCGTNLGKAKQDAVNLALLYGAQGSMGSLSGTEDEKVLATDGHLGDCDRVQECHAPRMLRRTPNLYSLCRHAGETAG